LQTLGLGLGLMYQGLGLDTNGLINITEFQANNNKYCAISVSLKRH